MSLSPRMTSDSPEEKHLLLDSLFDGHRNRKRISETLKVSKAPNNLLVRAHFQNLRILRTSVAVDNPSVPLGNRSTMVTHTN